MGESTASALRVIIVGASGNLGTALLRRLSEASEPTETVGISRRRPEPGGPYAATLFGSAGPREFLSGLAGADGVAESPSLSPHGHVE